MKKQELKTVQMKEGGEVEVDILNNQVVFKDVVLNGQLFKLLNNLDPSEWENAIKKVVEIGSITVYQAAASYDFGAVIDAATAEKTKELNKAMELTSKKLGDMPEEIQKLINKELESAFDFRKKDSPLKIVLDQLKTDLEKAFGKDSDMLKKFDSSVNLVFNADDPKSAVSKINSSLKETVKDSNENLVKELKEMKEKHEEMVKAFEIFKSVKDAFDKSTGKGTALEEDFAESQLQPLADMFGDVAESTGTKQGKSRRKTGDFVLTLKGTNGRKVGIEYKADQSYTDAKIAKEVELMKENRGTSFEIFVFDDAKYLPAGASAVSFKDGYVICTRDMFDIAYKTARAIIEAQVEKQSDDDVDFEAIQRELDILMTKKDAVEEVHRQIGLSKRNAEKASTLLDGLWRDVEDRLNRIIAIVKS